MSCHKALNPPVTQFRVPARRFAKRFTPSFAASALFSAALLFILPGIACTSQSDEGAAVSPARPVAQLSVQEKPRQQVTVFYAGKEVAVHHSGDALDKSYIHPLRTPDGRVITYDSPADHLHHRALCIGWPDVSGVDFWAEVNAPAGRRGKVVTRKPLTDTLPNGSARIREFNDWPKPDGTILLREERIWTFLPPRGNLQLVDVEMTFTAIAPEVVFGSDPGKPREYHGLTIRIGPFEQPRFFNSNGDEGDQQCHGKPAKWCALSGLQSGRPVTAAILDHPSNDCHPTRFFVLGQGMQFISSSPNFADPKILKSGQTWRLKYRILAAGAPPEGEQWNLQRLWQDFSK